MPMNLVIQKRRRELGLTQEQIADYLGVTTPAVNKWERGSTCPDIALLAPLARLLKIDLNTLLEFEEEITKQELVLFCKDIREKAQTDGFEVGLKTAAEKIRAYPNSEMLLYHAALQLQSCLLMSGLNGDAAQEHLKTIMGWYERLVDSKDPAIRNGACYMLASHAIGEGAYESAERYLKHIPDRTDIPDGRMLRARLLLKQEKQEDAVKLLQTALLTSVNELQMILYQLIDAEMAMGDRAAAEYAAQRVSGLAELFDLSAYHKSVAFFQIAVADRDRKRTVEALEKMLAGLSESWDIQNSPLFCRIGVTSNMETVKNMLKSALDGMKELPEYDFLREDREFQALLSKYQM